MMATAPWPAPREGRRLAIDRFPAMDTAILLNLGGLFYLSFFAILDIRIRKPTLRLDTSGGKVIELYISRFL